MRKRDGVKIMRIRQSAGKLRIGEASTTIPYGSRLASDWQVEVVGAYLM